MKTEAEAGVMWLQAKEHQGLRAVTRSWERGLGYSLHQSFQKEPILPSLTPRFQTSSLQSCERINLL